VTEPAAPAVPAAADAIAGRDRTIARLEADLTSLREILLDYMTAREAAEDEVRASEDRYRALIHRAAYGIFRATLDGRFIEVNPALVRTLGHPGAPSLLATIAGAVYYDPADHQRIVDAALRGEHPGWSEVRWRRHDGAPVLIRLTLQIVHDANGNAVALEGITEDVTDRARQEEMLRRSERMASLGHMLAGVAHELNNPLAAIGGFAQLLLRENLGEDDRSALDTINHEAQRAAKIVRDLLAFSRRHENERRELVDINDVVRYILDAQRYQIETQGIRRELTLAPDLPPVLAQASQLEQVVLNLVVNARQALEQSMDQRLAVRREGGSQVPPVIAIRTSTSDGTVTLEVQDNGPGIPEENRARIWDPFWTTKEEGEGTGLGLAVVHGIVSSYGGTIDVETEVDVGTRFVVKLPASASADEQLPTDAALAAIARAAARATTSPATPPQRLETAVREERPATARTARPRRSGSAEVPLRILVVDDETAILELLARYFTARGHTVVTTPNGARAIELARQDPFDVVICDLRMPALDGGEVIRQLRALPTCRATRYIVSTGDSTALPENLAEAGAAVTVLVKPYAIDELRRTVEEPQVTDAG
jgi:PAS domain S-box-containing protein